MLLFVKRNEKVGCLPSAVYCECASHLVKRMSSLGNFFSASSKSLKSVLQAFCVWLARVIVL